MEHLIPTEWFTPLPQFVLITIAVVAIAVLIKGADWLVEGASGIAYRAGISKVIVGATIVSLGTTSPEAAVSVMAAWEGNAGLALGNAVGSIIADTGLIFGLGCMLSVLPADRFVLKRQGWVQVGVAVFLAAVCYIMWLLHRDEAAIVRWVGVVLLAGLVAYMVVSVRWSHQHREGEPFQVDDDESIDKKTKRTWLMLIALMVVGLVLVLIFSRVLIMSVEELALRWGVPHVVIASTIVALGTSLPELVVGMTSIRKGHRELLVGNVVGADILNVLFVVGASAAAKDLPIIDPEAVNPEIFLILHLPTMLLILVLFRVFIFGATQRGVFRRWNGVPLLLIYLGYLAANFLLSRHAVSDLLG